MSQNWTDFDYQNWLARATWDERAGGTLPPCAAPKTAALRERDLHDQVIAYCRAQGWLVHHSRMDRPATCGVGSPDFIIFLPRGRVLCVECKVGKRKPNSEQQAWLAAVRALGHFGVVAWSLKDVVDEIGRME